MCYSCLKTLTNDKIVKYYNKDFCEDCIKAIYETEPKLMAVILEEDMLENCFAEFA